MIRYHIFWRTFNNIQYKVAIPRHKTRYGRKFRVLISQHGTRSLDTEIGADEYLSYPLDYDDPFWYDLIVVSPHFPAEDITSVQPNGTHFQRYGQPGLQWIHDLVHTELGNVFSDSALLAELNLVVLKVELERFYFYGHSRGGMAVHTYIMQFKGVDIFRAVSAGGQLVQRDDSWYNAAGVSDTEYLDKLDAFVTTPVASVLGTAEQAIRIESVRSFICREISQRVTDENLSLISPIPPVSLTSAAKLTCDLFTAPSIAQRNPRLQNIGYRFLWNSGANHRGYKNYRVARGFLFKDRLTKPLWYVLFFYPLVLVRRIFRISKMSERERLRVELEEHLDVEMPGRNPGK